MTETASSQHQFSWFTAFKYMVYLLLAANVVLFFQEEWLATEHTFAQGVSLGDIISGFAATIDTAAWVLLLLLFELETSVISDEKLKGGLKWLLLGIRAICYGFIMYAFYGYCTKILMLTGFTALPATDMCLQLVNNNSMMIDLDEYVALTASNCASLSNVQLLHLPGTSIYSDQVIWDAAHLLAWTDVINAGAWLLVVFILEVDVWMQLKYATNKPFVVIGGIIKGLLYFTLFAAAVYWGFNGDFLDFWDAFLWLVAFIFIEMNIFAWQEEVLEAQLAQS